MKDFLGQELRVGDNVVIVKKEKINWNTNVHLLQTKVSKINSTYISTENGFYKDKRIKSIELGYIPIKF
jgi:uncharacterized Zn ribbon protein